MYGCLGWSSWVRDVLQVALKGFVMGMGYCIEGVGSLVSG